jgi:hypothetical protein
VNTYPGVAGFGIALFCIALCALCASCSSKHNSAIGSSSGSSRSGTVDMFCFTSPDTRKVVVSSIFPVKTYPPERMIEEPWAKDFRRYIGQSGNEGGINVTCSHADSSDAAQIQADKLRKQGHEVVETKWAYAGG